MAAYGWLLHPRNQLAVTVERHSPCHAACRSGTRGASFSLQVGFSPPSRFSCRDHDVVETPSGQQAAFPVGIIQHDEDNGVMITLDTLQREKRADIVRLGENCGVRNIRVFGSVVRGDNCVDSDVDFLVDMEKGRTLFDLAGFVADVQDLLGVRVDVVTLGGLRYLRERVLAEAVPL